MAYVCNYCGRTIFTLETLHKHQKICVSSSNGVSSSKILEKTKEEKSKNYNGKVCRRKIIRVQCYWKIKDTFKQEPI